MTDDNRAVRLGILRMLLGAMAAVVIGLCVKAAAPGLSTETVVFLRFGLALLALAPLWWTYRRTILRDGHAGVHLLRGAASSLAVALYFYTLAEMPLANAMALQFTAPLFVPPLAALLIGERTGPAGYAGVVLAVAGAVLSAGPTTAGPTAAGPTATGGVIPAALGVLSAALGAGLAVHAKQLGLRGDSMVTVAFWFTLTGAALSGLYALGSGGWTAPGGEALGLLATSGVLGTLAQILVFGAYRYLGAALFAALKLLPIPAGALGAWLLFGELPGPLEVAGVGVIALGIVVVGVGPAAFRRRCRTTGD